MPKYLARFCPRCLDYFGVAASHPLAQAKVLPITAYCTVCGHQLKGWRLILGSKKAPEVRYSKLPEVFR
jgi:hypothetical protein